MAWARERVALMNCRGFDHQAAYAAMDFLVDALCEIAEGICNRNANLLDLSCDVIFVDTSSTYFQRDVPDPLIELDTTEGEREAVEETRAKTSPPEQATCRFNKHSKEDLAFSSAA